MHTDLSDHCKLILVCKKWHDVLTNKCYYREKLEYVGIPLRFMEDSAPHFKNLYRYIPRVFPLHVAVQDPYIVFQLYVRVHAVFKNALQIKGASECARTRLGPAFNEQLQESNQIALDLGQVEPTLKIYTPEESLELYRKEPDWVVILTRRDQKRQIFKLSDEVFNTLHPLFNMFSIENAPCEEPE